MSADEFSKLAFEEDFRAVSELDEASRWKVERVGDLEIYVTVGTAKNPDEIFQARFLWTSYPGEPPSFKFRDPASGRLDLAKAWPEMPGYRPANLDACVNWSAEGFVTHPEWKNDPNTKWNAKGNVLLKVLRLLQRDMDERFVRRSP
jgi:hypothetical protein